ALMVVFYKLNSAIERGTKPSVLSLDSVYEYERAISENAHGTLLMHNTRSASGESHGVHYQSDTPRRAGGLMSLAASKAAGCHLPTQTASNRPSSSLVFWSRIDALTCSSSKPTVETA